MKASEIRALSVEEMVRKGDDLKQELFNLRFQHETGQLENPQKMKQTKRDIARVKTIIKQLELDKKAE
ncbi:MAG: 50S ribosomal protein L29 [Deltaproteobacteria bacterium]|nr:50S ribosomal protein L29 [Deltaproteobacteria bacterium]MBW1747255.1 50S ribosomal protein L29 [Deltaproteobacteria bacterium]MBW1825864.1 50S ribosomal protein L29 [Deltaproteobacteria bacterium]MBW1968660.1 50S ribosomal protein L29 [Deltaproteobacteria bacterium]MBW2155663.1 50S ribosomal protein L29 [Deltaproteobacteria bacterium]